MTTLSTPTAIAPAKALLGVKLGMTRIQDENGILRPVAVAQVDTNVVTQVRTIETGDCEATQLALDDIDASKVTKPLASHSVKAGVESRRRVTGIRTSLASEFTPSQGLATDIFEVGQLIDATGTFKGRRFVGVMGCHSFADVDTPYGAHRNHRKPGSIGACTTPGRILRGLCTAGHMGYARRTVQNLEIRGIDADKGVPLISGAILDPKGPIVAVCTAVRGVWDHN